ncbi:MAG TPA: nucleosidase [Streptosporangiaceae bacterium]|nr:nucleosidase [Streptosporangiaceae bacterium]
MELRGEVVSGRPLLVLAVPEEAQFLDTTLPVLLTGMGKVNAAAALAMTLGRGPVPSRIVNLGTAGALRPGLGGMHIVRTVIQHDLDTDLLLKLTSAAYGTPITLADSSDSVVLASGDAFIADASARDALAERADLVDMEGYALAAAAASARVPISLVKHVTDEADEHAVKSWRDAVAVSARELADWATANIPGY